MGIILYEDKLEFVRGIYGRNKISTRKVVLGIFLSICCLAISQGMALGIGSTIAKNGIPAWAANIVSAVIYISVSLLGIKILTKKY